MTAILFDILGMYGEKSQAFTDLNLNILFSVAARVPSATRPIDRRDR